MDILTSCCYFVMDTASNYSLNVVICSLHFTAIFQRANMGTKKFKKFPQERNTNMMTVGLVAMGSPHNLNICFIMHVADSSEVNG